MLASTRHVVASTILHDELATSRALLDLLPQRKLDINVNMRKGLLFIGTPLMLTHEAHQLIEASVAKA